MVLLRGESGAGKSTVLQAIFWALYGSMRGIYNNGGQVKKCSVTLQINHLIIYRQKKPELLQVTVVNSKDGSQNTYEDDVAQQIIDTAFGPRELWKSCSYVSQKERCALLSGSGSERLTLLNQLSFDQDNPKDYIDIIDQKIKDVNAEFVNLQAVFTAELDLFSKQLTSRPVTQTLTSEQLNELRATIKNLDIEIQRLYQEVLNHERNIGSYNMISNQLLQLESQLSSVPEIHFDELEYNNRVEQINQTIARLREQVTLIRHYNNTKSRADKLQSDINVTQNAIVSIDSNIISLNAHIKKSEIDLITMGYDLSNPLKVTSQHVWQASQTENQILQNQSECKKLGCEYDQSAINSIINKYQSELASSQNIQRNIQVYNQMNSLKSQLLSFGEIDLSENRIIELEQLNNVATIEISEMKKGLELLQCPKCSSSLRHVGSKLIPGERDPVNPADIQKKEIEYKERLNIISKIRSGIYVQNQVKSLENQLNGIDIKQLEDHIKHPKDVSQHQSLISKLIRIQVIPPPSYSSSYLQAIVNHNVLLEQLSPLENQKYQLVSNLSNLSDQLKSIQIPDIPSHDLTGLNGEISKQESELKSINESRQKNIKNKMARDQISLNINNLKIQKEQLSKLLNHGSQYVYETTKQMLETNKTKLADAEYANIIISQQKQLEGKREKVINLNDDLAALQRLKQTAINVECKQLQDTVDTINQALTDILPLFFNEPIDMSLQLYKTLKTKKETKPGLNIIIKHKGTEYDNINQLSGGEGDRISLALVLALNQVSNSPVIMLDECVSSLDGGLKEACIRAMKSIEGKTIICVDHEGVEGYYDKTIMVTH
jgi:DNA repair exonuclease SbcCD ATPase subunit